MSEVLEIALDRLIPHPDNPNRMSAEKFDKLVNNIKKTGFYEPIVVRPEKGRRGFFQIINGEHRKLALEKLGHIQADCLVWDVSDAQTDILLVSLNRLSGSDILEKKASLIKRLAENLAAASLSKLIPATKTQIERFKFLNPPDGPAAQTRAFAFPLVFFVTAEQNELIEKAITLACKDSDITKQARKTTGLVTMAKVFLNVKGKENNG